MTETRECRMCHRVGTRDFVRAPGDTWECRFDTTCRLRQRQPSRMHPTRSYRPVVTVARPPAPDGHKRCSRCPEVKPLDEFYRRYRDGVAIGHQSACKACTSKETKQRLSTNPALAARHRGNQAQWRADNPDYFREDYLANREQRIAAAIEYAKANPVGPARRRERERAWYAATRDERRAVKDAWEANNVEKVRDARRRGQARRRARLRGLPFERYSMNDLIERDGTACVLCGEEVDFAAVHPDPLSPTVEHLECIAWPGSAGDVLTNVAIAHFVCNNHRRTRPHPAAAAKRVELLAAAQRPEPGPAELRSASR